MAEYRKPCENVTEKSKRVKAAKVIGERFVVPAGVWPDHECSEHDGAGWEVIVKERKGKYATCKWVNAKDERGKPWANEKIEYKMLRRVDADGRVAKAVTEAVARLDNFIPTATLLRLFHKVLSDEETKERSNFIGPVV